MSHLFRLRAFIGPYLWQIAANILALLASTGLALAIPRVLQGVIDVGLSEGRQRAQGRGLWSLRAATDWRLPPERWSLSTPGRTRLTPSLPA